MPALIVMGNIEQSLTCSGEPELHNTELFFESHELYIALVHFQVRPDLI